MELLGATASPFVRKVRTLLAETGYEDKVTFTPVTAAAVGQARNISAIRLPGQNRLPIPPAMIAT